MSFFPWRDSATFPWPSPGRPTFILRIDGEKTDYLPEIDDPNMAAQVAERIAQVGGQTVEVYSVVSLATLNPVKL